MTTKKEPTNSDLYKALGEMKEEQGAIKQDVKAIHEQTKKTNGRVTTLEKKQYARELIEQYVKDEGLKTPAEEKDGWTTREKALVSIIMTMLALASAVVGGAL